MKKTLILLIVMLLLCSTATADIPGTIRHRGNYIKMELFGATHAKWNQLVRDSLPFEMPGTGEVLLLRCAKLGSQITPDELDFIRKEFKLFNRQTGVYLSPVAAITVVETSSTFDLLFYEDAEVLLENYSLFCEGVEYTFDNLSTSLSISDSRPLREHPGPLPTMPPAGSFLEEWRPEYCKPSEDLIKLIDEGELSILEGEVQFGNKLAVMVFDDQDVMWKTSLNGGDQIAEMFPAEKLAANWNEADTVILIRENSVVVGHYGTHGSARRVDTMVTVVDMRRYAMYRTYLAFSSDPPSSIKSNSLYVSGAEGKYEYQKAIEQIAERLKD